MNMINDFLSAIGTMPVWLVFSILMLGSVIIIIFFIHKFIDWYM